MVKTLYLIALLALPLAGATHEPILVPPTPWGVNPCDLPRARCPDRLAYIHERLVEAQRAWRQDMERYWLDSLASWYAYNPDYRRHLHPHR